jgi:hypothetical protein
MVGLLTALPNTQPLHDVGNNKQPADIAHTLGRHSAAL